MILAFHLCDRPSLQIYTVWPHHGFCYSTCWRDDKKQCNMKSIPLHCDWYRIFMKSTLRNLCAGIWKRAGWVRCIIHKSCFFFFIWSISKKCVSCSLRCTQCSIYCMNICDWIYPGNISSLPVIDHCIIISGVLWVNFVLHLNQLSLYGSTVMYIEVCLTEKRGAGENLQPSCKSPLFLSVRASIQTEVPLYWKLHNRQN